MNSNGELVGAKTVIFGADPSRGWIAPLYFQYLAGGGGGLLPDKASYELYQQSQLLAYADMQITYTDAFSANISGPSTIHETETHTWSANVLTGVPPFTYQWYQDWNLVSTDASVTLSGSANDMLLRLDMTDARGHAVSSSTPIYVTHCADPKAEQC